MTLTTLSTHQGAPILGAWAGLRPGRTRVRLELQCLREKHSDTGGKSSMTGEKSLLPVIHNYGHGGSGHTLHWGCAGEVAELVMQCIKST